MTMAGVSYFMSEFELDKAQQNNAILVQLFNSVIVRPWRVFVANDACV